MKIIKRIFIGLFVLVLVLGAGAYFYLQSLKPDYNAELKLPDLKAPVEVTFDTYGIPHIYAQSEEDLFYAFGYIHAQDRLFQMEVLRRLADGRLAELFGEKAVPSDKFFRMLSFRQHAKMTIDSVYKDPNAPFVKAAKAYLKGINQYIHQGKTPIEFTLAGIPKTEFTLEDMEIIVGYMGYTFVGAFKSEPVATLINEKLGADYFKDVMSAWPDSAYQISVDKLASNKQIKAAENLAIMANQLTKMNEELPFPPFHGSNGWVISGKKTKSGKPILSNDTHIAFSQPSVWYEAHLECPTYKIYGNFLAGTPVPALGHSDFGGWGLTMFENDDADFFREKVNPANKNQVWYKDHWEDLATRKETIKVKGQPDLAFDVQKSRHGFILNGAFDGVKDQTDPIALWWVYHQFPSHHLEAFYNISHSKNAQEAGSAVSLLTSPGLNFMWGDTQGNIAWWAAGKIPKRPAHVNPQLILDGSTGNDDPQGWLDFKDNPQVLNPASGVLYTANNQPANRGTGLVAGYYVPANRAKRIEQLLFNDKADWTESELRKVINDVTSSTYSPMLKAVLPVINQNKLSASAKVAYQKLLAWDGSHDLEDTEPTMYYRFIYQTYQNAFEDELGNAVFHAFEHELSLKRNTTVFLQNDKSKWWDNTKTPAKETRSEILTNALNTAIADLEKQLGNDQNKWAWKNVHSIEHKHPLGILPVIGKYFNVGPIPVNGGRETINNLDFSMDSTGLYKVAYGPALRRIIDFGNPSVGYSVNPTGQSGYFMSKHYNDQAQMFADGGSRQELTDKKLIEKSKIGKMILKP